MEKTRLQSEDDKSKVEREEFDQLNYEKDREIRK